MVLLFLYALLGVILNAAGMTLAMWQTWAILLIVSIVDLVSHDKANK